MRTLSLVILIAACGSPAGPREPDEYTGCGADEHWRTFDDQAKVAVTDDSLAPSLVSPAPNAQLTDKVTFAWNQDPNDPGMPDGDVPHDGLGCNHCCDQYNIGYLTSLHLPPISGNAYDLQFTVDGKVDHRVITTLQEWGASDAVWSSWKGKSVSLRIWRMDLLRNDVKAGPYTSSQSFNFSVK